MVSDEVMVPSETEQLREQLMRAQRLSSVGTLASSVAHEFNNILTTIINYARLGLRAENDLAARAQAFEKILKGGQRAATIVNGMLGCPEGPPIGKEILQITIEQMPSDKKRRSGTRGGSRHCQREAPPSESNTGGDTH